MDTLIKQVNKIRKAGNPNQKNARGIPWVEIPDAMFASSASSLKGRVVEHTRNRRRYAIRKEKEREGGGKVKEKYRPKWKRETGASS